MLKIHDPSGVSGVIPLPLEDDKRFVTHPYNGKDTLTFELESDNPLYKYLAEEVRVEDEHNRYVVKKIDEHSDFIIITCDLDLDEWKESILYEFRTTNSLLSEVLEKLLPPGWTMEGTALFTKRTTVEDTEGKPLRAVTPFQVLTKASTAYSCVFNFDVINKVIKAIDPSAFTTSGQFFTDELNLNNLGFNGSSRDFATRLYAYGVKDEDGNPLTFASINDGKPYVEDFTYSDKVISVGWSDERYTNAESLLADAKKRLKALSFPSRSYSCNAQNLKEDVWLYKVVTLIDRRRRTRVDHQIIEYVEYPNHLLDQITLSSSAPSIQSSVDRIVENLNGKVVEEVAKSSSALEDAIDNATSVITGNKGGHFIWILDAQGRPLELVNLTDTEDINTAKSVWRWNASGLGHSNTGYNGTYALALLADGSINASAIKTGSLDASLIKTGVLKSADGKVIIDLSGEAGPVFNTGISTNGVTIRGDETGAPVLFDVDIIEKDGLQYAYLSFHDAEGNLLISMSEDASRTGGGITSKNNDGNLQALMQATNTSAGFRVLYDGKTVAYLAVDSTGMSTLKVQNVICEQLNGKSV